MARVLVRAKADLAALVAAGFDGVMVENFGDAPFYPERVPAETVAAMSAVLSTLRPLCKVPLGVNVLRNDGESAIAIAAATGADLVRINIITGAFVTDQGVIATRAHEVMRLRARLAPNVRVLADVLVKHAEPLARIRDIGQLVHDTVARGGADALVVSGEGTGRSVDLDRLRTVRASSGKTPIYIGSGFSTKNAASLLSFAHGAIVGSSIKVGKNPASAIDAKKAKALVSALR